MWSDFLWPMFISSPHARPGRRCSWPYLDRSLLTYCSPSCLPSLLWGSFQQHSEQFTSFKHNGRYCRRSATVDNSRIFVTHTIEFPVKRFSWVRSPPCFSCIFSWHNLVVRCAVKILGKLEMLSPKRLMSKTALKVELVLHKPQDTLSIHFGLRVHWLAWNVCQAIPSLEFDINYSLKVLYAWKNLWKVKRESKNK